MQKENRRAAVTRAASASSTAVADPLPAGLPRLHAEPETRRRLGNISHSKYYQLIKTGALRTVKIGRRRFASESAIDEYIRNLEQGANGAAQ